MLIVVFLPFPSPCPYPAWDERRGRVTNKPQFCITERFPSLDINRQSQMFLTDSNLRSSAYTRHGRHNQHHG